MTKNQECFERKHELQALEKQRKNSFLNFSTTFFIVIRSGGFSMDFFKGSSLKIACQEKAIFNAFLQRKPPLNVERIDASFLLTNFFFKYAHIRF